MQGTGNYNVGVNWTATGGSITAEGVFTPNVGGTANITATSMEDSTKSGSAQIAVTLVAPTITAIDPNTFYADGGGDEISGPYSVNGSGFIVGTTKLTMNPNSCCFVLQAQYVSPTQFMLTLQFAGVTYSPGYFTFGVCNGSLCSPPGPTSTIAFLGARNYLAAASGGELFFLDQAQGAPDPPNQNGYIRRYKADGSADGSCYLGGFRNSIAVDDLTGYVIEDGYALDMNGSISPNNYCDSTDIPHPTGVPSGVSMASAARNGYSCFLEPFNNSISCYSLTGGALSTPPVATSSSVGSQPWSIAMGVFGSETDAFVFSRNGTPTLYKVRASDAKVEGSVVLQGITPASDVSSANPVAGGWQVVAFEPPSMLIAATSSLDSTKSGRVRVELGKPSNSIEVSVSPDSATNDEGLVGWTQQFSASVKGTTNQQVLWSVNGIVGGNSQVGTISTTGLYTSPGGTGGLLQELITATSVADGTKSGVADIFACYNNSSDPNCSIFVNISPPAAELGLAQTIQFSAITNSPNNQNVEWSVNGIAGGNSSVGTITTSGLYTAPATAIASPAAGLVAILSTYDRLLLLIDGTTMQIVKSVNLSGSGTPFRIAADQPDGKVIVAYADSTTATTTYSAVDATTGEESPLTNTDTLLSVGLTVSADGKALYSGERGNLDVLKNQ